MRIHQILGEAPIIITNEEQNFIDRHHDKIPLSNLVDRDYVIARTLVRKGIYETGSDGNCIILKRN